MRLTSILLLLALARAACADTVQLVVLHVNDLHGYAVPREFLGEQLPAQHLGAEVGSLFSAATIVERWRGGTIPKSGDDGILFLDGGDTFSGALDDFETEGENAITLEASPHLDVDAAVVGNHSWDFGYARWLKLAEKIAAHHPLLAANLRAKDGSRLPHVQDYAIQEVRGVKIALVGLIAGGALHSASHEHVENLKVDEPMPALKAALDELRGLPAGQRPDLVFVLAHVAFERGRPPLFKALDELDNEDPKYNVDLVIDAHSHTDHTVDVDADTWLVQADHYGVKLGEVVLEYDRTAKKLAGKPRVRRIPLLTAEVPLHAKMMADHAALVKKARAANERPVVKASPDLKVPTLLRSDKDALANPSGNLFTRAVLETGKKKYGKAIEVALVNQTGVRAGLYASKAGAVSAGTVHAISPFANKLTVVKVTRASLKKVLEQGLQHVSKLSWAGLAVTARQPAGHGGELKRTIESATILSAGGAATPLDKDPDKPVTLIAPSFLVGRELKAHVIPGSRVELDLTDREALLEWLVALEQESGTLTKALVDRVVGEPAKLVR
jgi:5'-nucleotidase